MEYEGTVGGKSVGGSRKKDETKLNAYKDHMEALTKHVNSTQMFLNKETSTIDQKIVAIQAFIVK